MSSFLEQTRARVPRLAEAVQQQRNRLFVVGEPAQRAPRLPFAAFVLTVLGVGLVGLLVLNTSLQHQAFYARSLEERADALVVRKQALEMEVDAFRAPDRVAREAQALGMLPNHNPAFLFLEDGSVRGDPSPADPADALRLDPAPTTPGNRVVPETPAARLGAEQRQAAASSSESDREPRRGAERHDGGAQRQEGPERTEPDVATRGGTGAAPNDDR